MLKDMFTLVMTAKPNPAHIGLAELERMGYLSSIVTQNSKVQMSTARPGVMQALRPDNSRTGEIIKHTPKLTEADLGAKIISAEIGELTSTIGDATVIVSGGLGCKSKECFDQ
jgi:electron transfer flavoprotein alpha subunit